MEITVAIEMELHTSRKIRSGMIKFEMYIGKYKRLEQTVSFSILISS